MMKLNGLMGSTLWVAVFWLGVAPWPSRAATNQAAVGAGSPEAPLDRGMMRVASGCIARESGPSGVPWTLSVAWSGPCEEGLAHGFGTRWVARDGKLVAVSVGSYRMGRFTPPYDEVSIRLGRAVHRRLTAFDEEAVEQVLDAKDLPAWAKGLVPALQQAQLDRQVEAAQRRLAARVIAASAPLDEFHTEPDAAVDPVADGDEQPKQRIF